MYVMVHLDVPENSDIKYFHICVSMSNCFECKTCDILPFPRHFSRILLSFLYNLIRSVTRYSLQHPLENSLLGHLAYGEKIKVMGWWSYEVNVE